MTRRRGHWAGAEKNTEKALASMPGPDGKSALLQSDAVPPEPGTQAGPPFMSFTFYVQADVPADLQALSICCQALDQVTATDEGRQLVAAWLNKKYGYKVEL